MAQNIFITGALGFLGKFFVRGLLEQEPDLKLFLLVRGKGAESAEDRVRAAGLLGAKVTAVSGDITDGDLLDRASELPPMDEVWHIAGLTTFHESKREQLVRVNIHGTANMIALAERLQCKRYFHISTAYVAGICDGPVMEDELLPNPVFRNPYEETKYYGEKLVRESNLPWSIIRPSIIMGHSETGEADSDKMVYGVVRAYHSLACWVNRDYRDRGGIPVDLQYRVRGVHSSAKDYICVDDCVRLMATVRGRGKTGKTYHCCNRETLDIGSGHDVTCRILDIGYLAMDPAHEGSNEPKQQFVDRAVRVFEPYMLRSDPVFDLTNSLHLDEWHPVPVDVPRFESLVSTYVERLRLWESFMASQLDTSIDPSRLPDIRQYGDSAVAYLLTLSRQVQAFRTPGVPGYIGHAVVGNTTIMVGDPVTDMPEPLLRAFLDWRKSQGLSFCGIELRRDTAVILHAMGISINKMGVENYIDLHTFDPTHKGRVYERKGVRSCFNIAKRHDLLLIERPIDLVNPREVMRVSQQWMSRKKNQGELRLLLREISTVPEPETRYCFLRMGTRLLAFIFFMPMYRQGRIIGYQAGIERYDLDQTGLPRGFNAMRYIGCAFAATAKAEGCEVIALGMSPLYDVENSEFNDNPTLTRLMRRLYDESELYAFQGIAKHKKIYPCRIEEPVYIATEPDTTEESVLDIFKGVGFLE